MKARTIVSASAVAAALVSAPAFAHEAGEWIFRAGVGQVAPKSGNLRLPGDSDVKATITDGVTTESGVVPLGETSHLPPTVSVQYHFAPTAKFQPYAGIGVNWTTFFSEEITSDAQAVGFQDLKLDDSFGLAAQIGAVDINPWVYAINVGYRF